VRSVFETRYADRIRKDDATGCWIWQGRVDRDGYGRVGGTVAAHRLVWEIEKGPIPKGMTLDHLCSVRPCVNPAHLECVTYHVNRQRVDERRREREPVCPKCGGEWTVNTRGVRHCKVCVAEKRRQLREEGFE
jgi:HNH endonuclease